MPPACNGSGSSIRNHRRLSVVICFPEKARVAWVVESNQNYDEAVLWKNVNLCKMTALRLRYDPGTKTTSFLAE